MSYRRESVDDYPEHLNPFYERNNKIRFWKFGSIKRSDSFSTTLRNTLTLKSFRGKKSNKNTHENNVNRDLQLRNHSTDTINHRQTLPAILPPADRSLNTSAPLPRSRFSERTSKCDTKTDDNCQPTPILRFPPLGNSNNYHKNNIIDEAENKPAEHNERRKRHRKKRAPLPPMGKSDDLTNGLSVSKNHHSSKWSITSVDTDISNYSLYSDYEDLKCTQQETSEIIKSFRRKMEKLTDDTINNNNASGEEDLCTSANNIPDLIVSATTISDIPGTTFTQEEFECDKQLEMNEKGLDCHKDNDENSDEISPQPIENNIDSTIIILQEPNTDIQRATKIGEQNNVEENGSNEQHEQERSRNFNNNNTWNLTSNEELQSEAVKSNFNEERPINEKMEIKFMVYGLSEV